MPLLDMIQAVLYHIANLSSLYLAVFYFETVNGVADFLHML